ncbi:MAG: tRNA preQ1(34) S-adenosylmethionine ribosyltransferase-isomerase QueA [Nitrospirae bacterium]|nr:MAG: tRNA preQ1(34) S-adenosylmethionine ribosyltransferase-isomerase QueA [Nitrospirota bacterium]
MEVDLFDYELPPERIAQRPAEPRDAARLLRLDRATGAVSHHRFRELPELLAPGDLLVVNDTRVVPARLRGTKESGGRVEILLSRPAGEGRWEALVRGRTRVGTRLELAGGALTATVEGIGEGPIRLLRLDPAEGLEAALEAHGEVPLPPYIDRPEGATAEDRAWYQTVFAAAPGAVAAPTAGLHFTPELLRRLAERGIERAAVTLHVGPGTFRPVEARRVEEHRMESERYAVAPEAAEAIEAARRAGRRIVACGTTVTRVLESLWRRHGGIVAGSGETDLFLYPGARFGIVGGLITNFHLPRSTLLMLVAAFAGREPVLAAYAEALRAGYRFYSYGDAMVVL